MQRFLRYDTGLALTLALLVPQFAHAQAQEFFNIFVNIVQSVTPLISVIAILSIVILGVRMVASTDEAAISTMKTAMAAIIAGLFLTLLSPNIVNIFYYNQAITSNGSGLVANAGLVRLELLGIADWFQALAVIIGVATLIVSAFRAIISFGNEGSLSAVKNQVLYGVLGIILIIFASASVGIFGASETGAENTFFDLRNPNGLIEFIFFYVNIFLGFLLIIMVAILIYAGLILILNMGDESRVEQAKGIVIRSIVGLILVLFSVAIVQLVLFFFGAP